MAATTTRVRRLVRSALDPELVAEVLNIVRELADEGMTMLLATHEMSFAREASSRVCFLDQGIILEQGPPERIFSEPSDPRTQAFLKRIIETGRSEAAGPPAARTGTAGCRSARSPT